MSDACWLFDRLRLVHSLPDPGLLNPQGAPELVPGFEGPLQSAARSDHATRSDAIHASRCCSSSSACSPGRTSSREVAPCLTALQRDRSLPS